MISSHVKISMKSYVFPSLALLIVERTLCIFEDCSEVFNNLRLSSDNFKTFRKMIGIVPISFGQPLKNVDLIEWIKSGTGRHDHCKEVAVMGRYTIRKFE